MLPVQRAEVQLRQASFPRVHGQDFGLDGKTGSMNPPDSGIQDAKCFRHVLFGFGSFFKCGEMDIHTVIMTVVVELRQ